MSFRTPCWPPPQRRRVPPPRRGRQLAAPHRGQRLPGQAAAQQNSRHPRARVRRAPGRRPHPADRHRDGGTRALTQLPVDQRAAVVAMDMQGYSVADTARLLGVPEGTVKSRAARGRARLAALVHRDGRGRVRHGVGATDTGPVNSTPPAHGPATGAPRRCGMRGGRGRAGWPRWPPPRWNRRPGALPRTRVGRRHPRPQDHRDRPQRCRCRGPRSSACSTGRPTSVRSATRPGGRPVWPASAIPRPRRCWAPGRSRWTGRDAVLLVLAADAPRELTAVAVPGTCSSADTGLLADTTVRRP